MKKIFIIIIILILIAGALYFLLWRARLKIVRPTIPPGGPAEIETGPGVSGPKTPVQPPIDPIVLLKQQLTNQARTFIERYGSYSSDANFANLEDLLSLMSERLANETRSYITQERTKSKVGQPFYGLTTRVLSVELKEFVPDAAASFSASCQQQETKDTVTTTLYKNAKLKMIFENNNWKFDTIEIK